MEEKKFNVLKSLGYETHSIDNSDSSRQDSLDVLQPETIFHGRQPSLIVIRGETNLLELPQTLPHDMNVVDIQESQIHMRINLFRLKSATPGFISDGIGVRARIHNRQFVTIGIRFHDVVDVRFILRASLSTHTHQWLRASRNCRRRNRMDPRKNRQTAARPKRSALLDEFVGCGSRDCPSRRITLTNRVFVVDPRDAPRIVVPTQNAIQLSHGLVNGPTIELGKLFRVIMGEEFLPR